MKTGHAPQPARCALGKLIPDTIDTEELKHDAWHQHNIIVVAADDSRINWLERQVLQTIGERIFGRGRRG